MPLAKGPFNAWRHLHVPAQLKRVWRFGKALGLEGSSRSEEPIQLPLHTISDESGSCRSSPRQKKRVSRQSAARFRFVGRSFAGAILFFFGAIAAPI
jgi:hypothetical protein